MLTETCYIDIHRMQIMVTAVCSCVFEYQRTYFLYNVLIINVPAYYNSLSVLLILLE